MRLSPFSLALSLTCGLWGSAHAAPPSWQPIDDHGLDQVRPAGLDVSALNALKASHGSAPSRRGEGRSGQQDTSPPRADAEAMARSLDSALALQARLAPQLAAAGVTAIASIAPLAGANVVLAPIGLGTIALPFMGLPPNLPRKD